MLKLIKAKESSTFFTEERCYITEILNDIASPHLSMARCTVLPGITTQLHSLTRVHETYLIETGEGHMDDGTNQGFQVGPGDAILIEAGKPQRIKNTGTSDLVFTVMCRPRFEPGCYVNLERAVC